MLQVKQLPNKQYKIYSDEKKLIEHIKCGVTHTEYVVNGEPNLNDYKERD